MKKILILLLFLMPAIYFSQGMKITWSDSDGREFSINTHSRNFQYSMISGDKIYYNNAFSGGPEGTVRSVGGLDIYYHNAFSGGPVGSIKSTSGSVN